MNDIYPTSGSLNLLTKAKAEDVLEIAKDIWNTDYGALKETEDTLVFITGGWSGNEDIITAMEQNELFWLKHFYSYTRGGNYVFNKDL